MGSNMKKRVTLRDIAQAVGVSVNTVSHALNDKEDISVRTKEQVKKMAEELGYVGNQSASFMRSGVSRMIGIIVGDISNPHFAIMVKELETYLNEQGYVSFVFNTEEDSQAERRAINAALGRNADGIIICPTPEGEENIRYLKDTGTPFVLIGRYFKNIDASYVVCDDVQGGYEATACLLGQGHRRILFLDGPLEVSSSEERLAGYRKALEEYQVPYQPSLVRHIPITLGNSSPVTRAAVRESGCTAVVAFSDMIAWEVIYTLQEMGMTVPGDVSVVGFDNIQSRFPFPVRLSSVSVSKTTMSQKAADLLVEELQNTGSPMPKQVHLPVKIVLRDTTCPRGGREETDGI